MSSRGAEPHDHEPARQPTLAAYAPESVLPPAASAPDWRSRQGRWVDRSLSGRHHLPCCRGLFRPVAKSNPCTIPRSKRQRPSYRSRPHTPNLWTVPPPRIKRIEIMKRMEIAAVKVRRLRRSSESPCFSRVRRLCGGCGGSPPYPPYPYRVVWLNNPWGCSSFQVSEEVPSRCQKSHAKPGLEKAKVGTAAE